MTSPQQPKVRLKIEPEPGGQLEQYLVQNKTSHDEAEVAAEQEEHFKKAIKTWLLALFPDGQGLPDGFDIPADAHGRYPAYSMTLKKGKRFDSRAFKADASDELYGRYEVDIQPSWELRESAQGRRRNG